MADASVITGSPLSPARGRVNPGASFWPSTMTVAGRTVRKFVRTPQLIGLATVQSAIFLVIFRYIVGGAINAGALPHAGFPVPGFIVTGFLRAGMGAAAGAAEDAEQGLSGRLWAEALTPRTTACYTGLSLIRAAAITVVFGDAAAARLSRR